MKQRVQREMQYNDDDNYIIENLVFHNYTPRDMIDVMLHCGNEVCAKIDELENNVDIRNYRNWHSKYKIGDIIKFNNNKQRKNKKIRNIELFKTVRKNMSIINILYILEDL